MGEELDDRITARLDAFARYAHTSFAVVGRDELGNQPSPAIRRLTSPRPGPRASPSGTASVATARRAYRGRPLTESSGGIDWFKRVRLVARHPDGAVANRTVNALRLYGCLVLDAPGIPRGAFGARNSA